MGLFQNPLIIVGQVALRLIAGFQEIVANSGAIRINILAGAGKHDADRPVIVMNELPSAVVIPVIGFSVIIVTLTDLIRGVSVHPQRRADGANTVKRAIGICRGIVALVGAGRVLIDLEHKPLGTVFTGVIQNIGRFRRAAGV